MYEVRTIRLGSGHPMHCHASHGAFEGKRPAPWWLAVSAWLGSCDKESCHWSRCSGDAQGTGDITGTFSSWSLDEFSGLGNAWKCLKTRGWSYVKSFNHHLVSNCSKVIQMAGRCCQSHGLCGNTEPRSFAWRKQRSSAPGASTSLWYVEYVVDMWCAYDLPIWSMKVYVSMIVQVWDLNR
jgi:hypothetical protein